MKKTFMAPTVSTMDIKSESALLGASGIVSGGQAQSGGEGGVTGGNGGDALAKHAANFQAGRMDF